MAKVLLNILNNGFATTNGSKKHTQDILSFLGYSGNVNEGILSISSDCHFTSFDYGNESPLFLKIYLDEFYKGEESVSFSDPATYDGDEREYELDNEVRKDVQVILDKIEKLKKSGQFLLALPIIEKHLHENNHVEILSSIYIDTYYNIYLPEYNNLEIKLSHLSKCLYLLFINHPEGILLQNLGKYKEELAMYYRDISNRVDFDKQLQSIDKLIKDKNEVYVHLSRIKSIFSKKLQKKIAEEYIVSGAKNQVKKIGIDRKLITWDRF